MSAPVYIASMHDMGPGYLAFDLKEILAALKPFIAQYSWRITGDLDITSNGANREIESLVDRADLSSDELERLSEKIIQTIDGTVVVTPGRPAFQKIAVQKMMWITSPIAQLSW